MFRGVDHLVVYDLDQLRNAAQGQEPLRLEREVPLQRPSALEILSMIITSSWVVHMPSIIHKLMQKYKNATLCLLVIVFMIPVLDLGPHVLQYVWDIIVLSNVFLTIRSNIREGYVASFDVSSNVIVLHIVRSMSRSTFDSTLISHPAPRTLGG